MFQRLVIGIVLAFTIAAESSAGTDVGTFLSRCKPLQDIAAGKKKASVMDEKNLFWCAGHLSGILEGYRMGLLVRGDLDFAKSNSICPPENSTDAGLIIVVLRELDAKGIQESTTLATAVTAILSAKWPCR
jgi:Rap1a immunity proteins